MTYPAAMIRLLRLDPSGVRHISLNYLPWICMVHVSVLGLIYGGTAAWLTREMLSGQGLLKLTLAGIPAAFLMHAGAGLFIWVFLKALGGRTTFLNAYLFMGAAAISLWPLSPFVALVQVRTAGPVIQTALILAGVYGLAVTAKTIQVAFDLSLIRTAVALSAAVIYIGCFLYLWV